MVSCHIFLSTHGGVCCTASFFINLCKLKKMKLQCYSVNEQFSMCVTYFDVNTNIKNKQLMREAITIKMFVLFSLKHMN